jgi:hypothetical protein
MKTTNTAQNIALVNNLRSETLEFARFMLTKRNAPAAARRRIFTAIHSQFDALRWEIKAGLGFEAVEACENFNFVKCLNLHSRACGWQG